MSKRIPLGGKRGKGIFVTVDDGDYDWLSQYSWCISGGDERTYAFNDRAGLMHRLITNPPDNMVVDHINHDTLDNRRSNLRVVTQRCNSWNSKKTKSNIRELHSKFKGITLNYRGAWGVFFWKDDKVITKGSYPTELEAAVMYNKYAEEYYGEYACLNEFTPEEQRVIAKLPFRTCSELRMQTTPYHGVCFNKAKQRWQWRFMYHGKLYYDQYCDSAEDARAKLIAFLRTFDGNAEIKRAYKAELCLD